jgi:hypothetical protein
VIVPYLVLPAAALVLAAPDFAATLDVSNRTEVRARGTQGAPPPNPSFDLVDTPLARLRASNRRLELTAGYSIMALLPDVETGVSPQLLQAGDVGVAWHDRRVTIRLTEAGQYGYQNSAYLLGGGPPAPAPPSTTPVVTPIGGGVQSLPAPATIQFGSSRTALSTQLVLSRRWNAGMTIDYGVQGGLDAASRAYLPFVHGPRAEASTDYSLTRLDAVTTRVAGLRGDASAGPCSSAIVTLPPNSTCSPTVEEGQVEESWTHKLTRTSDLSAGAGAALVHERLRPQDAFLDKLYPLARAAFTDTVGVEPDQRRVRVEALLAPVLDVRTGILDERAQATVSMKMPLPPKLVFDGSLMATHSVASSLVAPVTYVQAFLEAEYLLSKTVGVGGGARYVWEYQQGSGTFSGEMVFGQVTLRVPTERF